MKRKIDAVEKPNINLAKANHVEAKESDSSSSSSSSSEAESNSNQNQNHNQSSPQVDKRKLDEISQNNEPKKARGGTPYRRVSDEDHQLFHNQNIGDNSYSSLNDTYGKKAAEAFSHVTGDKFRAAKTKKKRITYAGGNIDPNAVRSVTFD